MKFSFLLIKKLAPGKYRKAELVEELNTHSFEAADLGGDILEISVPPNRFSDASSHTGIAQEAAAIFNCKVINPTIEGIKYDYKDIGVLKVAIKDKKLCPRYLATYVSDVKIGPSPEWLKNILETCGFRSINNVVDIMNFVMIETGQPMHAFDADRLSGGIIVRRAENEEKFETIDSNKFVLDESMLVIADDNQAQAIAGIKGGKSAEVNLKTTRLLVEAASFNGVGIYNTSRRLNLRTDASVRFAHNLSPALAQIGMVRALKLLKELAAAKIYKTEDINYSKATKEIIKLDLKKIDEILGARIKLAEVIGILKKLGFIVKGKLITVPATRMDVQNIEDIAEEIARFKDYNKLPFTAPDVALGVAREDDIFLLKDKLRKALVGAGFSEVYNYSFISKQEEESAPSEVFSIKKTLKLANPLSANFEYLRNSLISGIIKNLKNNLRFFSEVRVFEIGKIFGANGGETPSKERHVLAVGIAAKKGFFEIKGLIDVLFDQIGVVGYFMPDLNLPVEILKQGEALRIESDDHKVLGYIGSVSAFSNAAILELDLEKVLENMVSEKEYRAPSKFPSVVRDLSVLVSGGARVGDILSLIQNASIKFIEEVDLIDFYEDDKFGDDKKSLTFRIVFQADDKTLTDKEVDVELGAISRALIEKFDAEIR